MAGATTAMIRSGNPTKARIRFAGAWDAPEGSFKAHKVVAAAPSVKVERFFAASGVIFLPVY